MNNVGENISILIADDDAEDQELLLQALISVNPNISHSSVYNGEQLIDFLTYEGNDQANRTSKPDAIILDINMPRLDGLSALRKIKTLDSVKGTPVFILTTSTEKKLKENCLMSGAERVYIKPNDFDGLVNILEEIIRHCSLTQERK